jgi:hypothetical protein
MAEQKDKPEEREPRDNAFLGNPHRFFVPNQLNPSLHPVHPLSISSFEAIRDARRHIRMPW